MRIHAFGSGAFLALTAGRAFLVGGRLPIAADAMRILGQVTQGEVNDITGGALMEVPEAVAPPRCGRSKSRPRALFPRIRSKTARKSPTGIDLDHFAAEAAPYSLLV